MDGDLPTETSTYNTPTNRQQHILATRVHICVYFKPLAHITVSHLCIGSDTFYIHIFAILFYYFYCIKTLYFITLMVATWPKHVGAYCMYKRILAYTCA